MFCDVSKAFDRVWHRGLLFKLQKCGITGPLLVWITHYIKDRFQRVVINGQFSSWKLIQAGVPEGSILGPLLFLIFINDITHVIQHCHIRLFADDTCLFIEVDDRERAAEHLEQDLSAISRWAKTWLVMFSPPKAESLVISNKANLTAHPPMHMDGSVLKESDAPQTCISYFTILHGDNNKYIDENIRMFDAVYQYITDTRRFMLSDT